uniref:Vomeronasal type-1 receptor n=1 Tax=Equus asinus TaxID=9793 RepID=A0A8C4PRZ1_EQUAS
MAEIQLAFSSFGISANTFLLLSHVFTLAFTHRVKPIDMTVSHLSLIHILLLFTKATLVSSDLFGSQNVQSNLGCKVAVFLSKVLRGLSISTTCLPSVLQAVTISPSSSSLAKFKHISPNHALGFFLFSWVLNMSISSNLLFYTAAAPSGTEAGLLFVTKHCSFLPVSNMHRSMFSTLVTLRDVTFLGSMVLSSGYMVTILYRHERLSQHLHSTGFSPRVSPAKRASQTVLLLVSCFVFVYWVDFTFSFSVVVTWMNDPLLATVSALLLITADKKITRVFQNMLREISFSV